MAKQTIPGIQAAGGGAIRKVVGPVLVVMMLVFIVKDPLQAAEWARTFGSQLGAFLNALQTFLEGVSA